MNANDDNTDGSNLPAEASAADRDDLTQVSGSYYKTKAELEGDDGTAQPIAPPVFDLHAAPTPSEALQTQSVAQMARLQRSYSTFDYLLLFLGLGIPLLTVLGACIYILTLR